MLAMRAHAGADRLSADEVPEPVPGPGELLIRVAAAGVNFADTLMVAGRYQEQPEKPFAPGIEVSGTVQALGLGTDGPPIGTRVAAMVGHGGFAEAAVARAAACVPVPDAMSDAEAAVLQVAFGTSHVALDHRARLRPGERLLVTGAAGGVGLAAIEVGRLMGAEVIAAARGSERLAAAQAAGAAHLVDVARADLRGAVKALGGADVVIDPVGGDTWVAALRSANPEARLLPIGFASGEVPQIPANILLVKNLTVIGFSLGGYYRFAPDVLASSFRQLIAWQSAGALKPQVVHELPLTDAESALDLLRTRAATGKIVLRPSAPI